MPAYDVVVIGLGIMGSAALRALARRGLRVVGIERFAPGHDRGSSHGATRIIRLGYFEHPSYVPLLRRAYTLWRELERDCGRRLMHITGIVEIGPPDGDRRHRNARRIARSMIWRTRCSMRADAMRRFPAFKLPADYVAVMQPDGGYLAGRTGDRGFDRAGASRRRGNTHRRDRARDRAARRRRARDHRSRRHRRAQRDRHRRSLGTRRCCPISRRRCASRGRCSAGSSRCNEPPFAKLFRCS